MCRANWVSIALTVSRDVNFSSSFRFTAGKITDEALATLGTSTVQFDHDLWQWGVTEAPEVWKVELVRYDGEE